MVTMTAMTTTVILMKSIYDKNDSDNVNSDNNDQTMHVPIRFTTKIHFKDVPEFFKSYSLLLGSNGTRFSSE